MNERTNTILKQLTFIHSGILWNLWIMVWKLLFLKEMWLTVTTWQCHGVWLYLDSAEGISVKKAPQVRLNDAILSKATRLV